MISILRAADRIAAPWKNGGGMTCEVAIRPPGSSFDDFDWRVSIAEVRDAGPFSRFENIDRTLVILSGRLALTFEDKVVELDAASASLSFRGEATCSGAPIDGAVTDLNVMTRRGKARAQVATIANDTHSESLRTSLLVARDEAMVRCDNRAFSLLPLDALLIEEASEFSVKGHAVLIVIA